MSAMMATALLPFPATRSREAARDWATTASHPEESLGRRPLGIGTGSDHVAALPNDNPSKGRTAPDRRFPEAPHGPWFASQTAPAGPNARKSPAPDSQHAATHNDAQHGHPADSPRTPNRRCAWQSRERITCCLSFWLAATSRRCRAGLNRTQLLSNRARTRPSVHFVERSDQDRRANSLFSGMLPLRSQRAGNRPILRCQGRRPGGEVHRGGTPPSGVQAHRHLSLTAPDRRLRVAESRAEIAAG
jgi:hypothetical protein